MATVKIPLSQVIGNDSGQGVLHVISVQSPTPNNGTATVDDEFVYYTPADNTVTADTILYTITDATAKTASAHIHLTISPAHAPIAAVDDRIDLSLSQYAAEPPPIVLL